VRSTSLGLAVTAFAAALLCGCSERAATPAPPPAPPEAERAWSAEQIAQDPAGYLRWADRKVGRQLADHEARLKRIQARLAEVQLQRQAFDENVESVQNLNRRMKQAMQRAEDEERWPLVLGGASFDAARARVVVEQTARYVEDRRPMADEYAKAVARLESSGLTLRKDMDQLGRLREKIALDIERIGVNQGVEELAALRQTESEIAGFADTLGRMADDSAVTLPVVSEEDKARMEVDAFLRRRN
jgi:hypothetical protein